MTFDEPVGDILVRMFADEYDLHSWTRVPGNPHDLFLMHRCRTCGRKYESVVRPGRALTQDMYRERIIDVIEKTYLEHICKLELGPAGRP
jgi:hypothetical protein